VSISPLVEGPMVDDGVQKDNHPSIRSGPFLHGVLAVDGRRKIIYICSKLSQATMTSLLRHRCRQAETVRTGRQRRNTDFAPVASSAALVHLSDIYIDSKCSAAFQVQQISKGTFDMLEKASRIPAAVRESCWRLQLVWTPG
jgi:hypothetical protein